MGKNRMFEVSFSLPYRHTVTVGVSARTKEVGLEKARTAFQAGKISDDTPDLPLLDDKLTEAADLGEVLEVQCKEVQSFIPRDAAVDIRRANAAAQASRMLVVAYSRGEQSGSVAWEDLDAAYAVALKACSSD